MEYVWIEWIDSTCGGISERLATNIDNAITFNVTTPIQSLYATQLMMLMIMDYAQMDQWDSMGIRFFFRKVSSRPELVINYLPIFPTGLPPYTGTDCDRWDVSTLSDCFAIPLLFGNNWFVTMNSFWV